MQKVFPWVFNFTNKILKAQEQARITSFTTTIQLSMEILSYFNKKGRYIHIRIYKYIYKQRYKLWKILKEMGIPDHLTWLLRNLYAGQEATVRTEHGTTDWFQIGKVVRQGFLLSPCLFNFYAKYIMRNAGLEEAQLELWLLGEISITS